MVDAVEEGRREQRVVLHALVIDEDVARLEHDSLGAFLKGFVQGGCGRVAAGFDLDRRDVAVHHRNEIEFYVLLAPSVVHQLPALETEHLGNGVLDDCSLVDVDVTVQYTEHDVVGIHRHQQPRVEEVDLEIAQDPTLLQGFGQFRQIGAEQAQGRHADPVQRVAVVIAPDAVVRTAFHIGVHEPLVRFCQHDRYALEATFHAFPVLPVAVLLDVVHVTSEYASMDPADAIELPLGYERRYGLRHSPYDEVSAEMLHHDA